jgi:hypothetical protein
VLLLLLAATGADSAPLIQNPGLPQVIPPAAGRRPGEEGKTEDEERLEREQAKQRNKERQAALKRDTDKLLELATQLKQAVDKSNEHTLSLDVVRQAEQIEKLAHSVREKMKGQ